MAKRKGAIAVSVFPDPVGARRRMSWRLKMRAIASIYQKKVTAL
ncbi:hypothetical protein [Nostoc sp. DSM 114167]